MFEASKHVWLPAKPTNDSMILSFPWVVKACLERWMQVSTVALTGQGETLWLAESPRGRKKKLLASQISPVSECWPLTQESFPGADPENMCSCFSFEILKRSKARCMDYMFETSVLCSQIFPGESYSTFCFTLSCSGQDRHLETLAHVTSDPSSLHPWKGTILVPGMFT